MRSVLPVAVVVAVLVAIWYAACIPVNMAGVLVEAQRAGVAVTPADAAKRRAMSPFVLAAQNPGVIPATWAQERPRLPAPDQVATELWKTTVGMKLTSKRSLVFHAWVTLSATLVGFAFGTGLGILLAAGAIGLAAAAWLRKDELRNPT